MLVPCPVSVGPTIAARFNEVGTIQDTSGKIWMTGDAVVDNSDGDSLARANALRFGDLKKFQMPLLVSDVICSKSWACRKGRRWLPANAATAAAMKRRFIVSNR